MLLENAIEMLRTHLLANAQFATDLASITEKTYQARGYAVDPTTLNDLFENIDNLDIKDIGLPLDPLITALATIRGHLIQFEREPKVNMRLLELVDNMALTRGRWGL